MSSKKNNFFTSKTLHEIYLVEYLSLIELHSYNFYYDFLIQKWSRCLHQEKKSMYPKSIFSDLKRIAKTNKSIYLKVESSVIESR